MGLAVSFDESLERDNRCNARNISKKINTSQSDYSYKNIKKFVSRTDNDGHSFLEGGKTKYKEKNEGSPGWERQSRTGRLAPGLFDRVLKKISAVGKQIAIGWEFCKLKITPIVCFCDESTHFFTLSLVVKARNDFSSETVDAAFLSFVN